MDKPVGKIDLELDGALARVTINNPDQRNAMSKSMWLQLAETLDCVAANDDVRALVITGAGSRAFCAGANIDELAAAFGDAEEMQAQNRLIRDVQIQLQRLPRPTVALVRGACYGGGCGLAMACDVRIADSAAQFAITPARLGILYSLEDTRRLVSVVGVAAARELLLTGLPVSAERARAIGLVQHVADEKALSAVEQEICAALLANSQYSLRWTKRTIDYLAFEGMQGVAQPQDTPESLAQAFDAAFEGGDFQEGSAAFLQRRKASFHWPKK
ncbi:enoyl-CoA hydratase/isomerase family protein [Biformimicrobium ophioploci]|uniref:Enoyl-CoA hydratase-related protein n=1 Tax=Biformimicrobium ophioploci TaxID=3036711 RepID=A0ABQ6LW48_9GAMM|nr:enoyl-CoA hydratase-related protein [Microbulbifer sp. NKW57]GMG86293.1 enoyl-CoA hydratase-related protein [Microbulbifer sp. NKW57]